MAVQEDSPPPPASPFSTFQRPCSTEPSLVTLSVFKLGTTASDLARLLLEASKQKDPHSLKDPYGVVGVG